MRWIDGNNIDVKSFSGEELFEKIGNEMYHFAQEEWMKCPESIRNAMLIIDFDTVINMEGFPTPYFGYFTSEYYSMIIDAFRTTGDAKDAEVLAEAGKIDSHYEGLLSSLKGTDRWDEVYDEFSNKIDELEKELYLNTDFDIWSLLYKYLDEQIALLK